MQIQIKVTSDYICPWCYIAEKRLERAIETLPPAIKVKIDWRPFELNANMPAAGVDRKAYRTGKFGSWEYSQSLDAKTVVAGTDDGALFNYDAIQRTPNTLMAHRVTAFAAGYDKQTAFAEAVLKGYFAEGRDIGSKTVLAEIANHVGLDPVKVLALLDGEDGVEQIRELERGAEERGIRGVPFIEIGETVVNGAQPLDVIRQTIIDAATQLSRRTT